MNSRAQAARLVYEVVENHKTLKEITIESDSFARHLCYGTLRCYESLRAIAQNFMQQQLKPKDKIVFYVLMVTLFQLVHDSTPSYAAINEGVQAVDLLNKGWAKGLINKISHLALQHQEELKEICDTQLNSKYNHPFWLIKRIKTAWPTQWQQILASNLKSAPMDLRVNLKKNSITEYLQQLSSVDIAAKAVPQANTCIRLEQAVIAADLPGFTNGTCSVQDLAGQLAIAGLELRSDSKVLDACAAPGSKTCHLLEKFGDSINLTALDKNPNRIKLLQQNLDRLQLKAKVQAIDAITYAEQNPKQQFDCILLDAPCSAVGVIRRHPEIKLIRNKKQVEELIKQQQALLTTLWRQVAPGGVLLYTTCSILPEENHQQIEKFLAVHSDAQVQEYNVPDAISSEFGSQLLPSQDHDGFFYAYLHKK